MSTDSFCPTDWTYYKDHCYRIFNSDDAINWIDAEYSCNEEGDGDGHLASIRDDQDMEFIHSLIVRSLGSSATPPIKAFIGEHLEVYQTVCCKNIQNKSFT